MSHRCHTTTTIRSKLMRKMTRSPTIIPFAKFQESEILFRASDKPIRVLHKADVLTKS